MTWRKGKRIGAPDMLPFSLANAMTEPEKVIAPMAAPSAISTRLIALICPAASAIPNASGESKAAAATSTAARPTRLWKAATSWGIAVIGMRRAMTTPAPPPISAPPAIRPMIMGLKLSSVSVTPMAMAMPIMPYWLPRRAVSGFDRPRRARMNRTPETR